MSELKEWRNYLIVLIIHCQLGVFKLFMIAWLSSISAVSSWPSVTSDLLCYLWVIALIFINVLESAVYHPMLTLSCSCVLLQLLLLWRRLCQCNTASTATLATKRIAASCYLPEVKDDSPRALPMIVLSLFDVQSSLHSNCLATLQALFVVTARL